MPPKKEEKSTELSSSLLREEDKPKTPASAMKDTEPVAKRAVPKFETEVSESLESITKRFQREAVVKPDNKIDEMGFQITKLKNQIINLEESVGRKDAEIETLKNDKKIITGQLANKTETKEFAQLLVDTEERLRLAGVAHVHETDELEMKHKEDVNAMKAKHQADISKYKQQAEALQTKLNKFTELAKTHNLKIE